MHISNKQLQLFGYDVNPYVWQNGIRLGCINVYKSVHYHPLSWMYHFRVPSHVLNNVKYFFAELPPT